MNIKYNKNLKVYFKFFNFKNDFILINTCPKI